MASFAYTAINSAGLELDGQVNAPDANAAREALRVRGLVALTLDEQAASSAGFAMAVKKVKPKSLQVFSRQFATMIDAGLSVVSALVILEQQTEDKYLGAVIKELRADVEGGVVGDHQAPAARAGGARGQVDGEGAVQVVVAAALATIHRHDRAAGGDQVDLQVAAAGVADVELHRRLREATAGRARGRRRSPPGR